MLRLGCADCDMTMYPSASEAVLFTLLTRPLQGLGELTMCRNSVLCVGFGMCVVGGRLLRWKNMFPEALLWQQAVGTWSRGVRATVKVW